MTEAETGSVPPAFASQTRTRGARPPRLVAVPEVVAQSSVVNALSVQTVTVLPSTVNLVIYQGDDFYLDVSVTDSASNPVNVTSMSPMSQIRTSPNAPAILASINAVVDATVTNLIHLHLNAIDSNSLPVNCAWDLQLSQPSVTTIAAGTVSVTPQVTQ